MYISISLRSTATAHQSILLTSTNKSQSVGVNVVFRNLACLGGRRIRVRDEYERLREHTRVSIYAFHRRVDGVPDRSPAVRHIPRHRYQQRRRLAP